MLPDGFMRENKLLCVSSAGLWHLLQPAFSYRVRALLCCAV